jgi:dTDP-glucose 4,6-dehydratase
LKLLITGGAGFIGSNFTNLVTQNSNLNFDKITVLDNLTYAGNLDNIKNYKDKIEFIKGDIRDRNLLLSLTKQVDAIVNFAAESHVDRSIKSSNIFMETNILGLHNLLECAKLNGIESFVQVSTDEVYGSIKSGTFTENSALNPSSPYAASKASADLLALSYFKTYDLNIKITRSSNNYGPMQYPEKMIPLFITNLIQRKKLPIYGSGLNIRDWLYVEDNCEAILRVLEHGQPGRIYNIGAGTEMSNLEIASLIMKKMKINQKMVEHVPDRKGHDFRYSIDSSRIKNELGFSATTLLGEGLEKTVSWYQNNFKIIN